VKTLRQLLVDDQALFREALRTLLGLQVDFEVVGEAGDGEAAVMLARDTRPDVVLMDLRMPGVGGVEATRRLRAEFPALRVIVLTTFEEDEEVFAALRAGAAGYLLKASPSARLCEAIRLAARGETFLEPSVAAKLVTEFARLAGGASTGEPSAIPLTPPIPGVGAAHRAAVRPGARGPALSCAGIEQQGDRRPPLDHRGHGKESHEPGPRQTRRSRPHPGRAPRARVGADVRGGEELEAGSGKAEAGVSNSTFRLTDR